MLRPDVPLVFVSTRDEWRTWLEANCESSTGVWVVTRKKASLRPQDEYVSASDVNRECLCFGWIDSKPGRIDDEFTALLCTPRKRGSGWSKVNKDRIAELVALGLMHPHGLAAISAAKTDGSWDALNNVDSLVEPNDLLEIFERFPGSRENWNQFPPSARRGILEWILAAKKPETRLGRITTTAESAQIGERANQWRR